MHCSRQSSLAHLRVVNTVNALRDQNQLERKLSKPLPSPMTAQAARTKQNYITIRRLPVAYYFVALTQSIWLYLQPPE